MHCVFSVSVRRKFTAPEENVGENEEKTRVRPSQRSVSLSGPLKSLLNI